MTAGDFIRAHFDLTGVEANRPLRRFLRNVEGEVVGLLQQGHDLDGIELRVWPDDEVSIVLKAESEDSKREAARFSIQQTVGVIGGEAGEARQPLPLLRRPSPLSAVPFSLGSGAWPGLSKLVEEAGEVIQIAGKLMATRGAVAHWDGTNLRERLAEELADLSAAVVFVLAENGMDDDAYRARVAEKLARFRAWHSAGDPLP